MPENLSPRQRQILTLWARGETILQIARALRISRYTVKTHLQRIYEILGINTKAEAVLAAVRLGLITAEDERV